jgi:hypothetical protein
MNQETQYHSEISQQFPQHEYFRRWLELDIQRRIFDAETQSKFGFIPGQEADHEQENRHARNEFQPA